MSLPSGPSSSQNQTAGPTSKFKSMLDDALAEYKKKTGEDLQAIWLASELQTCESVDSVLDILRDQAKAFERSGDRKLMKWVDPLVHVLYTFSDALGDGVSLAFPPAKVIFTGIGVLLGAARDVRASHSAIIDLFERIEIFFKRLEVYNQTSLTTEMAEVLIKIVIELLSILSIATKEVRRRRAKLFARKLLGMTDIEDALRRLDGLIQEEVQMAIAQILKVANDIANEIKDGAVKANTAMQQVLSDVEEVKCDVVEVKRDVGEVKYNVEEVKWAQIEQDIYSWFSPPDPYTNYNIACRAHSEGTATWFFQSSKFKSWMSIGSLLWIYGKPGSGKSIICSTIIKYLISLRDAGQASLAFFYFDFRDEEKKQDFGNFVKSVLVQLAAYSSSCCEIIFRMYSSHGKGKQQPSNDALTKCLRKILSVAAHQPVYLIVDALDECPDSSGIPTPREDVLNLLEGLVRLGLPNLRICVTSRPEVDIKDTLDPLASGTLSLHDESGQMEDIFNYVRKVVYSDKKMRKWRSDQKGLVVEELSRKADGMFRWVFCQLEVLRHCLPASIRQTLNRLPESLDETYIRVLRQIPHTNQAHAHRILQCLMVAVRPLRVEELAELLAFEFDETQGGIPRYRGAWRLDDHTEAVLSTCSSLVTIVYDWFGDQVVQFSHFSVKEFLMSNRLGTFSQYYIRPVSAHTILTQACLGFLLHSEDRTNKESIKGLPLAKYAAQHWVEHAQFDGVASRVKDGLETLFDSDKPHFMAWVGIYDMDNVYSWLLSTSNSSSKPEPNPLYYSVLCGLYGLVEHLVIKHPKHVNAICGRYRFPLLAALEEDHLEIAELLLEHGASVDVRETAGKTKLLQVLSQPQRNLVKKVKFLLKHGADVNARDRCLRSPLHLAEYEGELEVAQILVKHKADIDSQDNDGKTSLHILSEHWKNNEDDVLNHARFLFEHGAEVDRRDKANETPLHLAIRNDLFKLARILLEQGAEVNAQNNNGKTPLHILLECHTNNEDDVLNHVRFLFERGAEVNRRDNANETPLHLAIRSDLFKLARILLDYGADANAQNNNGKTPLHGMLERQIYDKGDIGNVLDRTRLREYGVGVHKRRKNNETPLLLDIELKTSETLAHQISRGQYGFRERGVVPRLLKHGVDIAENHLTPLHSASPHERLDISLVPLDDGANVNSEGNFGRTPLNVVAGGKYNFQQDRIRFAQLLLDRGTDVNAPDSNSSTPLHIASYFGGVEIARLLLDHGAAANSKDRRGRTALHSVAEGKHIYSEDNGTLVAQLLLVRGADVNASDEDNNTPLHLASYHKKVEVARVLLNGDAFTNLKDNQGRTPLHAVAEDCSADNDVLARLLLERGADVNAPDDKNETPLHLASYFGRIEIVSILLNAGANASTKNAQGQTPLHLVSECQHYSGSDGVGVAQLLLEHGADVNAQDKNHATPLDFASYPGKTKITSLLLDNGGEANAKVAQRPAPRRLRLKYVSIHDEPSVVGPACTPLHTPVPLTAV